VVDGRRRLIQFLAAPEFRLATKPPAFDGRSKSSCGIVAGGGNPGCGAQEKLPPGLGRLPTWV